MLDRETFKKGMKYLNLTYTNFKFDLNDAEALEVWYDRVKMLDDDFYSRLIKTYCENNRYAPQSPFDLVDTIKQSYMQKELDCEQAWEYIKGLIRKHSLHYGRESFYKELEDKPLLKKLALEFEPRLRELRTDDINTPKEFKNAYKSNLATLVQEKQDKLLNNNKQIATDNHKLLENKER